MLIDYLLQGKYYVVGILQIALSAHFALEGERLPVRIRMMLRQAGLATYPVYLLHASIGIWLTRNMVLQGMAPLSALLVAVAIIVVAGWVVARFGEPPLRALIAILRRSLEHRLRAAGPHATSRLADGHPG